MRASPVSMRKDLEGEARVLRCTEECAIGETTLRRVYVCAARGEEARCRGSGEDEPEREDIWGYYWRVVVSCLHFRELLFVFVVVSWGGVVSA